LNAIKILPMAFDEIDCPNWLHWFIIAICRMKILILVDKRIGLGLNNIKLLT
jgi:hypothetical protein